MDAAWHVTSPRLAWLVSGSIYSLDLTSARLVVFTGMVLEIKTSAVKDRTLRSILPITRQAKRD